MENGYTLGKLIYRTLHELTVSYGSIWSCVKMWTRKHIDHHRFWVIDAGRGRLNKMENGYTWTVQYVVAKWALVYKASYHLWCSQLCVCARPRLGFYTNLETKEIWHVTGTFVCYKVRNKRWIRRTMDQMRNSPTNEDCLTGTSYVKEEYLYRGNGHEWMMDNTETNSQVTYYHVTCTHTQHIQAHNGYLWEGSRNIPVGIFAGGSRGLFE